MRLDDLIIILDRLLFALAVVGCKVCGVGLHQIGERPLHTGRAFVDVTEVLGSAVENEVEHLDGHFVAGFIDCLQSYV